MEFLTFLCPVTKPLKVTSCLLVAWTKKKKKKYIKSAAQDHDSFQKKKYK